MFKFIKISLISVLLTLACQNQIFAPQTEASKNLVTLCEVLKTLAIELKESKESNAAAGWADKYDAAVADADARYAEWAAATPAAADDAARYAAGYATPAADADAAARYAEWAAATADAADADAAVGWADDAAATAAATAAKWADAAAAAAAGWTAAGWAAAKDAAALADVWIKSQVKAAALADVWIKSQVKVVYAIKIFAIVLDKPEMINICEGFNSNRDPEQKQLTRITTQLQHELQQQALQARNKKLLIQARNKKLLIQARNKKLLIGAGLLVGVVGIYSAVKSWLSKKPRKVIARRKEQKLQKKRACQPAELQELAAE